MQIVVTGSLYEFAVLIRASWLDGSTSAGLCGLAFGAKGVVFGDIEVDCVVGTAIAGLEDLLTRITKIDSLEICPRADEKSSCFFYCDDFGSGPIVCLTEVGVQHKFALDCECFDGELSFVVAQGPDLKLVRYAQDGVVAGSAVLAASHVRQALEEALALLQKGLD